MGITYALLYELKVFVLKFIKSNLYLIFFLIAFFCASNSYSQQVGKIYTPKGLEGKVEFWKLIFARYGKHHRIFHNRKYPEVIYSVIDFSEYEEKLSGSSLMNAKLAEVENEKDRIVSALIYLANGNPPRNDFERRIDFLYSKLKGNKRALMLEGASKDLIRYQTGIKERFYDAIVRSGRYLRAIEHIFVEEGLPPELGRLPFVESSFDYTANSSVGAAGIWQFMPATAKSYMQVDNFRDERRDPIIASRAAARYLKNSYINLKDWPLAVTSYNHGLSGVMRGVKQVGSVNLVDLIERYDSKSFGFASSNFYAEFLAALEIDLNAEKFFPGIVRERAMEFEEVRLGKPIKFNELIRATNSNEAILYELNRGFKDPLLKSRVFISSGTNVKVPYGTAKAFNSKYPGSMTLARSTEFRSYLFKEDRTNERIVLAQNAKSIDYSEELSPSRSKTKVENKIEVAYETSSNSIKSRIADSSKADTRPPKNITYSVERGDTLIKIAKKHGVSVKEIMKTNNLKSHKDLKYGKDIIISQSAVKSYLNKPSAPSPSKDTNSKFRTYRVVKGDTLYALSRKYNISANEIMRINGLSSHKDLKAGRKIKIPG